MALTLADDRPPIPPADLILRVSPSFDPADIDMVRTSFDVLGLEHLRSFERALATVGRSFGDFRRMLDFGCGCGRFVRHLGPLAERLAVHGTDIDAEMIEWCRTNIPYGEYQVAPHEPPLTYPDHSFDLIINHSVFTHLDERHQDLWLAELQRIASPGAMLLLTVEGTASWNRTLEASERVGEPTEQWQAELESRGILFITDDHFVGSTHPDFYHSTLHAPWYVFEQWTRYFDLIAYLPEGSDTQDLVVLRRRPDGAPAPRPIGHRGAVANAQNSAAPAARWRRRADAVARRIVGSRWRTDRPDPAAIERELNMLRSGLYEQGKRISVLAAELRAEIEAAHRGDDQNA
jgi:SAM-dependent methyltransferase